MLTQNELKITEKTRKSKTCKRYEGRNGSDPKISSTCDETYNVPLSTHEIIQLI